MKEPQVNGLKRHRRFDETYRRHAVELSLRTDRTVKAVAEELGILSHLDDDPISQEATVSAEKRERERERE